MDDNNFELWARSLAGQPEQFAAGQTNFAQGQTGTHMYIVCSGSVDIVIDKRVVETVGPNGIFGDMVLVDGGARSTAARAKSACELAPIDQRTFVPMVDEAPYFALSLMRVMAGRLRRMGGCIFGPLEPWDDPIFRVSAGGDDFLRMPVRRHRCPSAHALKPGREFHCELICGKAHWRAVVSSL